MDTEQLIRDAQDTQNRRRCRYILNRGAQCGSPALRGTNLCYFHSEHRGSPDQVRERKARHNSIILPPRLQTRADIQQALATTAIAIAGDDIDPRRAGLLLYALQIASCNLNEHQNNHFRQLPNELQHLDEDPEAAAKELARQQQHESHPHYGTGPRPEFTPAGEPISTAEDYVSAERKAHEDSLPDFTPRPPHWTKLTNGVGPLLLEALGKHHSKDQPLPGEPSDRRRPDAGEAPTTAPIVVALPSTDETQPMVIAAMQATATETAFPSSLTTTLSFRAKAQRAAAEEPPAFVRGATYAGCPISRRSRDVGLQDASKSAMPCVSKTLSFRAERSEAEEPPHFARRATNAGVPSQQRRQASHNHGGSTGLQSCEWQLLNKRGFSPGLPNHLLSSQ